MFSWTEFTTAARDCGAALVARDERLAAILSAAEAIAENIDDIGTPFPDSVGIHKHPDQANLKRILEVRKSLATEEGNEPYVTYANCVVNVLDGLVETDELYLIQIATHCGRYEFCFCPQRPIALASDVSKLRRTIP